MVDVLDDGRLREAGTVTHEGRTSAQPHVRRAFVVGRVLYTLSTGGLLASDLDTLAERSWLGF